ncbi:MAG: hypothetical protein ACL93V_04950 [Candidatus Electrothrix sp. YB6]
MSLSSRLKKIRSRSGPAKNRSGRSGRSKQRRDSGGSGTSNASSSGSGRAILRRSKKVQAGRADARRARADARADQLGLPSVVNPVTRTRSNAVVKPPAPSGSGKTSLNRSDTKIDFSTGRTLFPVDMGDGRIQYLPAESEATAAELSQGKYVSDSAVEVPPVGNQMLDRKPLFEFANQRNLFATKAADGDTEYLPKRSDANSLELKQGRYVSDDDISLQAPLGAANSMSNTKPLYDMGKGRKVFPVKTKVKNKDGSEKIKIIHLPSASDATAFEKARGLYIPDNVVDRHERKRRRTALKDNDADHALRRARRADKLAGEVTAKNIDTRPDPVTEARDGTAIWNGSELPEVSEAKQRETLEKVRPKYDLGKERMVYPVETAKGKIEYLPLQDDATTDERIDGRYAAFVPPEPLEDFLADAGNGVQRRTFDTELGEVKAYGQKDIEKAFEVAPSLVLRSARLVREAARENPGLQQEWSEVQGV